jgi:hypothetical protein
MKIQNSIRNQSTHHLPLKHNADIPHAHNPYISLACSLGQRFCTTDNLPSSVNPSTNLIVSGEAGKKAHQHLKPNFAEEHDSDNVLLSNDDKVAYKKLDNLIIGEKRLQATSVVRGAPPSNDNTTVTKSARAGATRAHPCDKPGFRKLIVSPNGEPKGRDTVAGSERPLYPAIGGNGTETASHELFSLLGIKEAGR